MRDWYPQIRPLVVGRQNGTAQTLPLQGAIFVPKPAFCETGGGRL